MPQATLFDCSAVVPRGRYTRLRDSLQNAQNEQETIAVLKEMGKLSVDIAILRDTKIGIAVSKCRQKHSEQETIRTVCSELLRKWRRACRQESDRRVRVRGRIDTSSVFDAPTLLRRKALKRFYSLSLQALGSTSKEAKERAREVAFRVDRAIAKHYAQASQTVRESRYAQAARIVSSRWRRAMEEKEEEQDDAFDLSHTAEETAARNFVASTSSVSPDTDKNAAQQDTQNDSLQTFLAVCLPRQTEAKVTSTVAASPGTDDPRSRQEGTETN
ncbi:MAG: hypothetical protein MHM6MM_001453 [Cercozoa sp. M6MM]